MKRTAFLLVAIAIIIVAGCQSGMTNDPIFPQDIASAQNSVAAPRGLWGLYEFTYSGDTGSFDIIPLRTATFSANVTNFLGGSPPKVGVEINSIDGDVFDIDVILSHPFPGLDVYTGFDVLGVFIGEGSLTAQWNPDLAYGGPDDQRLLNADGYTRWYNPSEFNGTMPLFSYVHGQLATPGYKASATLMPYKYFSDDVEVTDDAWTVLTAPGYAGRGCFTPTTNRRNYIIQFPDAVGVTFNYAVVANWEPNVNDPDPPGSLDDFPPEANAREAVLCNINMDDSTMYWDGSAGSGSFIADISILDWYAQASGAMEEYTIRLSTDVNSTVYDFSSSEMTPTGFGDNYYTYHVEFDPDSIHGLNHWLWVVVEYPGYDYGNDYGVPNDAEGVLQACFYYEFEISGEAGNQPPVVLSGVDGPDEVTNCNTSTYSVTVDDPDGDPLTYTWSLVDNSSPDDDFSITGEDEDMEVAWEDHPEGTYRINCRISDGEFEVEATPLVVTRGYQESCCPDVQNEAYPFSSTPTTMTGQWCYLDPAVYHGTTAQSSIDMDFLHDTTNRLVVNCRTLDTIACVTPQLNTIGTNHTVYVSNVEAMSIDVTNDNKIVYVEFDNSVLAGLPTVEVYWPKKTKAVEGADTEFHVFDTVTMSEVGSGFDVGARIQAVCPDEYGKIWVFDENNVMHCYEESGSTYVENTGLSFDMDTNGSAMEGLVFDFAIDYYNEAFYILTNASIYGYLYRVECNGAFLSSVEGNSNPMTDIWSQECDDRADIFIDNHDSNGDIHDGEQDAQICAVANIHMPYSTLASKIGITRVDAALGSEIWYLFEGTQNVGYGATCASINDITNEMYTKCGPPYGNQYIVHKFYVPSGEWY